MTRERTATRTTTKTATPASAASRRDLLKGLSLAGLAAGSTALAMGPAQAEPVPADPAELNYRETDHVRKFYDLARR